ncbi:UDP-N-acetylmuramoyl-L-alanine--D-glutamate ligase [Alkalibacterium kapii]|uniref:UDP-N-acetylmuramoylalanine--D-glutamate ligase n=1 Tax=Alkalibacterium kapii TaxID=426704 RepID=A0A511ATK5_9LACT|nr:UDP-N-acetylmuramoyl-L-alanine--D-glutamate ligase [Alkalibacterium kapii]GEK91529.1 UDP-N-acetylmuramoylalanine--D-glutamate ligase [Alkalibacterium kapii]
MKNTTYFNDKNVLVLGLAVSGYNTALLLFRLGAKVVVNDFKDLSDNKEAEDLKNKGIKVISGGHPMNILEKPLDFIVKNPGIPYSNPLIKKAMSKKIKIITEVELADMISESPVIAITGTNGKTTTTMMCEALLNQNRSEGKAYAVGNIGVPASLVAQESSKKDDLIMEVSSFQLMGTDKFHPSIAVITNIYSAHLDYHKNRKEYVEAKMAITKNQKETDYIVFNRDQEELTQLIAQGAKAESIPFSRKKALGYGTFIKNNRIMFNDEEVMPVDDLLIPGEHNLENALAAITVAKLKGVPNEDIKQAFNRFKGVKHRLQLVDTVNGRTFYNDSKATNVLATKHALESFSRPVILIAGGLDRKESHEELIPVLEKHVKAVVTFGETKSQLAEAANKAHVDTVIIKDTVSNAAREAFKNSEEGDVIVLSPACASWDQYANFEERGNDFIETVRKISQSI